MAKYRNLKCNMCGESMFLVRTFGSYNIWECPNCLKDTREKSMKAFKFFMFAFAILFFIGFVNATTVTLNSPTNGANAIYYNATIFNATASSGSSNNIANITLYDNSTGTWGSRNITTFSSGSATITDSFTTSSSGTGARGNIVNITGSFSSMVVTKNATTTPTTVYLFFTNNTLISSANFVGNNATITANIITGQYYLIIDGAGSAYIDKYQGGVSYPITGTNVIVTNGAQCVGSGISNTCSVDNNFKHSIIGIYVNPSNTTTQTFSNSYDGLVNWNVQSCDSQNNCAFAPSNFTVLVNNVNSVSYHSTTYETSSETFSIDLTGSSPTSVTLNYAGTNYSTTNNNGVYTTTLDIPTVNAQLNNTFYWQIVSSGSTLNTINYNQTVYPLIFTLCNATYSNKFINFTFKDEETNVPMTDTLTSSFVYYIGSGSISKSYSYQSVVENSSYTFCSNAPTNLYVTPSLQYSNSTAYNRIYNYPFPILLSSVTTNKTLYLLLTSHGIISSYQVVNVALQGINNVSISFATNGNIVTTKLTDTSGVSSFFLNPNTVYNLTATLSGYNNYNVLVYPSQSQYTIMLTQTTGNITSYNQGVNYTLNPQTNYINSGNYYLFNVTMSSSYLNLQSWGFNLSNGTNLISQNTSGSGGMGNLGTLTINQTIGNYTNIGLTVFWNINGTIVSSTTYYTVENLAGNGFSIYNGIVDLKKYIGTGIFGLTPFGLNIIIFALIFITTGIFTFKFGLYSPTAIAAIVFTLVFMSDIVFGLIYYDPTIFINKAPHMATIFVGLIFVGLIIREVSGY